MTIDFFEFSNEMLCVANTEGYFIRLNSAWTDTLGWSVDELKSRPFIEFVHEDDVEETIREADMLRDEAYESIAFRNRYRCQDGSYKWLEWKARTVPGTHEVIATARDVTHQREQTQALRESEQRFRAIYEQAPLGVAILDSLSGRFLQVNPKLANILGRSQAEILQSTFLELTHPDDLQSSDQPMASMCRNEIRQFCLEKRYLRPDGTVVWANLAVVPLWEEGESPSYHLAMIEDVTDRKQAESQLQEQHSQLMGLLEHTPAVVYVKDREGRHVLINQRFEKLFQHDGEEVRGKTVFDLNPEPIARMLHEFDEEVWRSGEAIVNQETLVHRQGPCTYRSVKFPIKDEHGNMVALGGVSTDITDLTKAYEELKEKQKLLHGLIEVQEEEKQLMCYEIHDGLIQYAAGSLMQLETFRDLNPAACQETPLDEVIADLRTGVEEGRRVIRGIRPTVLDDMGVVAAIEDLVDQMSHAQGTQKSITIDTEFDPRIDRIDRELETTIYRVAQEAMTNARKHGKPERIAVSLWKVDKYLQLEIKDNGCGFEESEIGEGGFGILGMRERVRLVGGNLRINATPYFGTHIIARFPLEKSKPVVGVQRS